MIMCQVCTLETRQIKSGHWFFEVFRNLSISLYEKEGNFSTVLCNCISKKTFLSTWWWWSGVEWFPLNQFLPCYFQYSQGIDKRKQMISSVTPLCLRINYTLSVCVLCDITHHWFMVFAILTMHFIGSWRVPCKMMQQSATGKSNMFSQILVYF